MPEYEPPHVDKKETIDEKHRLKMLELAIEGIEGLGIETIELERKGISYTYDTMKLLTEQHPDTITLSSVQIWWIICPSGAGLMSWLNWFSLLVFSGHATRRGLLTPLSGWMCPLWIFPPVWCGISCLRDGLLISYCLSQV